MKCLYGVLPHTMMSSFIVMSNPVLCVALQKRVKHYGTALRKCQSLTSYYRSVKIALQACQTPCNVWYYSCVKSRVVCRISVVSNYVWYFRRLKYCAVICVWYYWRHPPLI